MTETKRLLQDILDEIRDLKDRVEKLEKSGQKRNLPFAACIPPLQICKDIVSSGNLGTYEYHMQILSDYYGVKPMGNYNNPERVPKNAIACYIRWEESAYYKENPINLDVILHEFFHHLHANGVVRLDGKTEEDLAVRYAQIIIKRGSQP